MSPLHEMVMNTGRHKPIMFAVISLLAFMLIFSPFLILDASAARIITKNVSCVDNPTPVSDPNVDATCCYTELEDETGISYETCCDSYKDNTPISCSEKVVQGPPLQPDLPQLETVPPIRGLPSGGDVPTLEQVPSPGLQPGSDIPTLEQGPGFNQGTEGEPPLPVVCSEEAGLEKDPETGQCVPIESPVTEEPEEAPEEPDEEQSEPEEEQPSEESDSGDESNN